MKIVPALLASSAVEARRQYDRVQGLGEHLHYDVGDGMFVPGTTIAPESYPEPSMTIFWHLMVDNPATYLERCLRFPTYAVVLHVESQGRDEALAALKQVPDVLTGLAVNPTTPLTELSLLLPEIDLVQIMTVEPGAQGQPFLANALERIPAIREHRENILIGIDGGMSRATIPLTRPYRPDYVMVGSALQEATDPAAEFQAVQDSFS